MLGTVEVGNTVPYTGGDGEWKLAGRDAILIAYDDGTMRVLDAKGEERIAERPAPLYRDCVRDLLDHWRRGAPPPIGIRRGFLASGISRTRSIWSSPFSRLAPVTWT